MKNRSWERHEAQDRLFCFFGGSWVRFVGHKRPTWPQLGPQDGAQIAQKSMPKLMKKSMPLGIDFWMDFCGFWEGKWRQVGTQMGSKTYITSKDDFLKNRAPAAAGARFLRSWGSKLRAKIDQKSIKKSHATWSASWHRFLVDFDRFSEPSWGGKSTQHRCKKVSKKRWKKEGQQDDPKIAQNRIKEG